jgi:hypothetical protein
LPLGHAAAEQALQMAAKRGAMKSLTGKLAQVRVARMQTKAGNPDRTLVVVESQELLEGQKRGIAVALRKAKTELSKLDRLVKTKRISRNRPRNRTRQAIMLVKARGQPERGTTGNRLEPMADAQYTSAAPRSVLRPVAPRASEPA